MKGYKGWELIKMANEGKIKEGDTFKIVGKNVEILAGKYNNVIEFKLSNLGTAVFNSVFIFEKFTKIQKPLTFFEAMKAVDEGKKVTNSYVLDGIKKGDLPKGYWYKDSKGILVWHDVEGWDDRYDTDLVDKELQSNWYIYED